MARGGVVNTLNTFDLGDIRTTSIIVFYGNRVADIRIQGDVINTLQARMGTGGNNMPLVAQTIRQRAGKPGGGKGNLISEEVSLSLQSINDQALITYPIQDGREIEKHQNGIGLGSDSDPSYTLDRTGAQSVAYDLIARRLTPLECERLQGFPDDWTSVGKDTQRYKQMGNAVTVNVIEWIGARL